MGGRVGLFISPPPVGSAFSVPVVAGAACWGSEWVHPYGLGTLCSGFPSHGIGGRGYRLTSSTNFPQGKPTIPHVHDSCVHVSGSDILVTSKRDGWLNTRGNDSKLSCDQCFNIFGPVLS